MRELAAIDPLRHDSKIANLSSMRSRGTGLLDSGGTLYRPKRKRRPGGDEIAMDAVNFSLGLEVDSEAIFGIHLEGLNTKAKIAKVSNEKVREQLPLCRAENLKFKSKKRRKRSTYIQRSLLDAINAY